jgi:hypothetical protein
MPAEAVVEEVVEEVATNLEETARAVRLLNAKSLIFLGAGLLIGGGTMYLVGRRRGKKAAEVEAMLQAEVEIASIREYYHRQQKPGLDEIIEKKGYSSETVPPPSPERPLSPPVPVQEPTRKKVARTEAAEKDKNEAWSYPYELSQRDSHTPYIIHQDEFHSNENEHHQTSYIYYEGDDTLVDAEDNTILNNRENLIGTRALNKFGHGSDDKNIVYVRNPELDLEVEIIRESGKYETAVLGLDDGDESGNT